MPKSKNSNIDYTFFMGKALKLAKEALLQGEFPVGAVVVYENEIIATGSKKGTSEERSNEIDHAEMLCLKQLANLDKIIKINKDEITIFCTLEPCLMCFGAIILSEIGRIIYAYEDIMGGGTNCDLGKLAPLYTNSKISIIPGVLRQESLELFKTFFSNAQNNYWGNSLLSRYTLQQ